MVSCNSIKPRFNKEFYRIKISFNLPIKMRDTTLQLQKNNVFASFYGKYAMYELPYHVTLEDETKIIYDSLKFEYFIFNKKDSFGYLLKHIDDSFITKKTRESFLNPRAFKGGNSYGKFMLPPNKKVQSYEKIYDNGLKQTYRYLLNGSAFDSIYFMFDKSMINIDFSIYKHEDSAYNSKLVKVILYTNPDSMAAKHINYTADYYTNSLEFTRDTAKNESELIKVFKRYKEYERSIK